MMVQMETPQKTCFATLSIYQFRGPLATEIKPGTAEGLPFQRLLFQVVPREDLGKAHGRCLKTL